MNGNDPFTNHRRTRGTAAGRSRVQRSALCLTLALSFGVGNTAPSMAQEQPTPRSGFWANGGLGMALGAAGCNVCTGSREVGVAATLGGGMVLTPAFALGLDANGWTASAGNVDLRMGSVTGVLLWYPNPRSSWYFSFGTGLMWYRAADDDPDGTPITSQSLGLRVGLGYDVPLSEQFAVTPFFNFVGSMGADLTAEGESLTGTRLTLLQLGASITYR